MFLRKELSPGLDRLLTRVICGERLNNFSSNELRFLHLVVCKMYGLCLNFYLLREAIANAGLRDNAVLSRKVPGVFWRALFRACGDLGVRREDLVTEESRAALCLRFNSDLWALSRLTDRVLRRCGVACPVRIAENNLVDGNYLFNLGASIPTRCLLALGFCIRFWGDGRLEPWVRLFAGKFFVLYLLVSGHLGFRQGLLVDAADRSYRGLLEAVTDDLAATRGLCGGSGNGARETSGPMDDEMFRYLFGFNNNVLFPVDDGERSDECHHGGQKSQNPEIK